MPSGCVLDVTGELVIEPGVTIAFEDDAGVDVYSGGSVQAEGSETEPITFQGPSDLKGWWRGIHIETNSPDNLLLNVAIRRAGSNYVYCCNNVAAPFVKSGRVQLENSAILNSGGCGVTYRSAATFEEPGNTYTNNADGNVCAA